MKFCTKCGKQLFDEAVICPGCGCPTEIIKTKEEENRLRKVMRKLSDRLKINATLWIIIGCIQALIGLQGVWCITVVGILNIISASKDLSFCKNPFFWHGIGIFERFENITKPIMVLVYNLIFGGVIGIVGSIYYLAFVRGFVMENEEVFPDRKEKIA